MTDQWLFKSETYDTAIARSTAAASSICRAPMVIVNQPSSATSSKVTSTTLGLGTTSVIRDMEMAFEDTWAHFCVHHFNQDGLVRERSGITAWLGA